MKIAPRWSLFIVGIAIAVFSLMIVSLTDPAPAELIEFVPGIAPILAFPEQKVPGLPVRLKIPKIKVDATFEYVGLTPSGAMDSPDAPAKAAWFEVGPKPGEQGSAVIAGHFGWKNGVASVFDNLHTLRPGDKIYVEDEKGSTSIFVVSKTVMFGENEDASSVFFSKDGFAHLNLITCEGIWSKDKASYSNRLVVFAELAL